MEASSSTRPHPSSPSPAAPTTPPSRHGGASRPSPAHPQSYRSPSQTTLYPPAASIRSTHTAATSNPRTPPRAQSSTTRPLTTPPTLRRAINTSLPVSPPTSQSAHRTPPSAHSARLESLELTPLSRRSQLREEDSPFHDRHSIVVEQPNPVLDDPFEYSHARSMSGGSGGRQKTMAGYKFASLSPPARDEKEEVLGYTAGELHEVTDRPITEYRRSLYPSQPPIPITTIEQHPDLLPPQAPRKPSKSPANAIKPSFRTLFSLARRRDYFINFIPGLILACASGLVPPYMSSVVGDAFQVFESYPLDDIATDAQRAAFTSGIQTTCIKLTVAGILGVVFNYLKTVAWIRHGETHVGRLRQTVYVGMQRKGMEWFDLGMGMNDKSGVSEQNGETVGAAGIMSKFTRETDEVRIATSQAMGLAFTNAAIFIFGFILAMKTSPKLTLVTLSTIPLLVLVQIITQMIVGPLFASERRAMAEASTNIERATSAIATVKAHNAQASESARFDKIVSRGNTAMVKQGLVWGFMFASTDFLSLGTFVVGFWYGAKLVQKGELSNGDVMTVFWACLIAAGYLQNIVPQLTLITKGKNSMASLLTMIQDPPERPVSGSSFSTSPTSLTFSGKRTSKRPTSLQKIRPPRCRGEFNFRNVQFAYPSRPDNPVLRDVTLFLPPGETTFIVGGSGSGKSTIAQLLLRLYEPLGGEITLDNQSFAYLDEAFTKEHIAAVQQGCILFDLSVHDNVAMGRAGSGLNAETQMPGSPLDVTRQEVIEACKMAMIHDFIESLPDGYETKMGTGGSQLSGGQKQRLAIARARIRDPTILILDEATSALDATSRVVVFENVKNWRNNKTTIVITHDLSQILPDDFVYVMKDGIVAEQGFRSDLMQKTPLHGHDLGVFASMAAEQAVEPVPLKFDDYADGSMIEEILEDEADVSPESNRRDSRSRPHTPSFAAGLRPGSSMYLDLIDEYVKGSRNSVSPAVGKRDSRRMSNVQKRLSWSPQELDRRASRSSLAHRPPSMGRPASAASLRVSRQLFPPSSYDLHHTNSSLDSTLGPSPLIEKDGRLSVVPYDFRARTLSQNLDDELKASDVTIVPHTLPTKVEPVPSVFKLLYRYYPTLVRRYFLVFGVVASICHGVATPFWASYLSKLMQCAGTGTTGSELTKYALIVLALCGAQALSDFFQQYCLYAASAHWSTSLRTTAYTGMMRQDKTWFDKSENAPSNLVQMLVKDTDDIRALASTVVGKFVVFVVMVSLGIIWAIVVDWRLTLCGVALAPVFAGVIMTNETLIGRAEVRNKAKREALAKVFYESIANIRGIRAMALDGIFRERFDRDAALARRGARRDAWRVAVGAGMSGGMMMFCQALLNWAGYRFILNGWLNYVRMLQVYNLVLFSLTFATQMLDFIPTMSKAKVAARDFYRLVTLPTSTTETSGELRFPITGNVKFDHVSFSYPTRPDVPILADLSFSLAPGECVAIVGPSGSGKSTIAALLQRLYEPTGGKIHMDRFDLSRSDVKWLRNHIAVVSQSANLFDASVADNIAYGSDVPMGEIHRAAQAANIHEFIQSLPQGYDTNLGENASLISGGQAQRLQIARALVRRSNILILDECTSALDVDNQRAVLDTIVRIKDTRTTVFITHSVEAMKRCDRIICLGDGRVAEEGSFDELTRRGGVFAQLMRTGEWE